MIRCFSSINEQLTKIRKKHDEILSIPKGESPATYSVNKGLYLVLMYDFSQPKVSLTVPSNLNILFGLFVYVESFFSNGDNVCKLSNSQPGF